MANKLLAGLEPGGIGFIDVAEAIEAGDLVGYSAGWKLAKQGATAIPAIGVVDRAKTYVAGGDNKVQLHTRGIVREASGLTVGAPVYLAADGEVSATAGANFAQIVGIAISTTEWIIAINAGVGASPSAHVVDLGLIAAVVPAAVATTALVDAVTGNFAYDTAAQGDAVATTINAIIAHITEVKADYNDAVAKLNALLIAVEAHGIVVKA